MAKNNNMIILGIHDGHNASAALLKDGKIICSVAEERLSRQKNHYGFPFKAIDCVLSSGKLKFQNVKQTAPLTFKLVKEVLDECIDNEEHVNAIIKAIKDKRESKYVYDIRRTYS